MSSARPLPRIHPTPDNVSALAGFLSYLVPGLGQMYQGVKDMVAARKPAVSTGEVSAASVGDNERFQKGLSRFAKGMLFFVCLYTLFFYGLYLGEWQNVYIQPLNQSVPNGEALNTLRERAPFIGQLWIGVAAWPAMYQYLSYDPLAEEHPVMGKYQRPPSEAEQRILLRDNDKGPDLGWTYTVIAGVLNILVIYDAFAGAAFGVGSQKAKKADETTEETSTPKDKK